MDIIPGYAVVSVGATVVEIGDTVDPFKSSMVDVVALVLLVGIVVVLVVEVGVVDAVGVVVEFDMGDEVVTAEAIVSATEPTEKKTCGLSPSNPNLTTCLPVESR